MNTTHTRTQNLKKCLGMKQKFQNFGRRNEIQTLWERRRRKKSLKIFDITEFWIQKNQKRNFYDILCKFRFVIAFQTKFLVYYFDIFLFLLLLVMSNSRFQPKRRRRRNITKNTICKIVYFLCQCETLYRLSDHQ